MDNTPTKRVAFYCRVASADQIAIDHQKESLRIFAEEHGYTDFDFYIDNGCNGLDFNRPAFMEMEADIKTGKIKKVVSVSLSRIGRNSLDVEKWINGLKDSGVKFATLTEPNIKIIQRFGKEPER